MKIYLGHCGQFLQPKNKLEKFLQNYLQQNFDRKVIDETEIEKTKAAILKRIVGMNLDHAKCTPIEAAWWTNTPPFIDVEIQDWILDGCHSITFSFMCSKEL